MLQEGHSREEVKAHVLANYLTDEAMFEKDFYDFEVMLKNYKLVQKEDNE